MKMRAFLRTLKFTALGLLGIVGVSLIWFAVANAQANGRIDKKLAELRAAGQPLSLADLARKPIPPETNAATYLRRAKIDVEAIEKIVVTAEESPEVKKLQDAKASDEAIEHSEPMMLAYRQAVAAHPNTWPLLEKASACPDFDPQFDFSTDTQTFIENILPAVQDERAAIRALRYRALVQLADGQREDAFHTCLTMFRLANHFDQNPLLVGFLVAVAVRSSAVDTTDLVLLSGPLPPADHEALEKELARHDVAKAYGRALVTDRALGIQAFDEFSTAIGYTKLPIGKNDYYSCLELFDVVIEGATRPYSDAQARASVKAVLDRAGALTALLGPALDAASVRFARTEAKIRSLRVLNAILAREQAGNIDEQPKLADLGLPAETTTDPYNGQPMHVKKTADGWLIYSVGSNLKDDGGKLDDDRTDVGLGPAIK
jgi:hypothetical protein